MLKQIACNINAKLHEYIDSAEILTPYATEFRYPGEIMNPSKEEMDEALLKAKEILDFIFTLLPADLTESLE